MFQEEAALRGARLRRRLTVVLALLGAVQLVYFSWLAASLPPLPASSEVGLSVAQMDEVDRALRRWSGAAIGVSHFGSSAEFVRAPDRGAKAGHRGGVRVARGGRLDAGNRRLDRPSRRCRRPGRARPAPPSSPSRSWATTSSTCSCTAIWSAGSSCWGSASRWGASPSPKRLAPVARRRRWARLCWAFDWWGGLFLRRGRG